MSDPGLVSKYDQVKSTTNAFIDDMVAKWRDQRAAGSTEFEIFGKQIVGIHEAQPSYERLAVVLAFAVERLAQDGAQ